MYRTKSKLILGLLSVAATLLATVALAGPGSASTSPDPDGLPVFGPGQQYQPVIIGPISVNITNPWFPLPVTTPLTTLTYKGIKDGEHVTDVVTVTNTPKNIPYGGVLGTNVVPVTDILTRDSDNKIEEKTSDYFAQDGPGNVWYFGEDTVALDANGNLTDTTGSWLAGVNGAQPGVIMVANPADDVNTKFRQEYSAGVAEDQFKIVNPCVTSPPPPSGIPGSQFSCTVETAETSALEPSSLDNKYYAKGIGVVADIAAKNVPVENLFLVSKTP
jgi:hypothetical protein